ncbi:hypothetical protein NDU88_002354 [Pleurodeles waltl]|uniref:Uncharacterized protein n=1 Tax=Pleurodeles waltl TaxID=8319 RepID=A0AAV7KRW7_PLEWA|nr:hypothetical protein NDU88_002354 [Pleurodeles waltl]
MLCPVWGPTTGAQRAAWCGGPAEWGSLPDPPNYRTLKVRGTGEEKTENPPVCEEGDLDRPVLCGVPGET